MPWMCFLPISTTLTVTTITISNSDITSALSRSLEADAPEEQAQTHSLALLLGGGKTINEKYFLCLNFL